MLTCVLALIPLCHLVPLFCEPAPPPLVPDFWSSRTQHTFPFLSETPSRRMLLTYISMQDYASSSFDDSDHSEPEPDTLRHNEDDGGNLDIPDSTAHVAGPSDYHSGMRSQQRDSMLSFMSGTAAAALLNANIEPTESHNDGLVVTAASDSDGAPQTGTVQEVVDAAAPSQSPTRISRRSTSPPHASAVRSESEDGASTLRPGSGASQYDDAKNVTSSPRRQTPSTPHKSLGSGKTSSTPTRTPTRSQFNAEAHTRMRETEAVPGPRKTKVVVRDCEYATYLAVLYYVSIRTFQCRVSSYDHLN